MQFLEYIFKFHGCSVSLSNEYFFEYDSFHIERGIQVNVAEGVQALV
jgi:hypothetical protein